MNTEELDYTLPEELIAQRPVEPRDAARLLIVDREAGSFHADSFANLSAYLRKGDCLVLNDTRVIRARLLGQKPSGGRVELFLLRESTPARWEALVKPSAKLRPGTPVDVGGVTCVVEDVLPGGKRLVRFETPDVLTVLNEIGAIPLPPYIRRDAPDTADLTRYQTVFAARDGAVAAPTAGLHYTPAVLDALDAAGIGRVQVTLHVGYGTFKPIKTDRLDAHSVDPEDFEVAEGTARTLNDVRQRGGRVVAVGTTATRVLETIHADGGFRATAGSTNRYIYPPYDFHGVDALQTNFHLPRSSLLALVYAFGGVDFMREAYAFAVAERFRFYSYGDTMLII